MSPGHLNLFILSLRPFPQGILDYVSFKPTISCGLNMIGPWEAALVGGVALLEAGFEVSYA